jgi:hypothetical protein
VRIHVLDQTEVPLSFKKVIDKLFGQRVKGEKGQPPADAIKEEKIAAKKDKKKKDQQKASTTSADAEAPITSAVSEDEQDGDDAAAAEDAAESAPQSLDLPPPMATFADTPFAPKLMDALTSAFPSPSPIQAQVRARFFMRFPVK